MAPPWRDLAKSYQKDPRRAGKKHRGADPFQLLVDPTDVDPFNCKGWSTIIISTVLGSMIFGLVAHLVYLLMHAEFFIFLPELLAHWPPKNGYDEWVGVETFLWGCIGALVGGLFGFHASGALGRWLDECTRKGLRVFHLSSPDRRDYPASFTLFITVHYAKDFREVGGPLAAALQMFNKYDAYVAVDCGTNPAKATCVRHDSTFNETFKFLVQADDEFIAVQLKDQDLTPAMDIVVGEAQIKISHVIEGGFPVMKSYYLMNPSGTRTGQVTLSFDWGDDFSGMFGQQGDYLKGLEDKGNQIQFERRRVLYHDATATKQQWPAEPDWRDKGQPLVGPAASGDFAAGPGPPPRPYGTFAGP